MKLGIRIIDIGRTSTEGRYRIEYENYDDKTTQTCFCNLTQESVQATEKKILDAIKAHEKERKDIKEKRDLLASFHNKEYQIDIN